MSEPAIINQRDNEIAEPQSETASILSLISQISQDPNVDLEKMERIIAMRDRDFERVARDRFNRAMTAAQAEMRPVARDAKNGGTGKNYASYEAISKAIQPIIEKYGFSLSFDEGKSEVENCIKLVCTVSCGGYEKNYSAHIPIDAAGLKGNSNKNATQAFGSTITYGRRYLKMMVFDIAVTDDDGQSANIGDLISSKQRDELIEFMSEHNVDVVAFCRYLKINSIAEIPAVEFGRAWHIAANSAKRQKAQNNG